MTVKLLFKEKDKKNDLRQNMKMENLYWSI